MTVFRVFVSMNCLLVYSLFLKNSGTRLIHFVSAVSVFRLGDKMADLKKLGWELYAADDTVCRNLALVWVNSWHMSHRQ